MVHEIIDIKDNSFWKKDLDESIADYKQTYGIPPRLIAGGNFVDVAMNNYIHYHIKGVSDGLLGRYEGVSVEINPELTCVIVSGE